MASQPARAEASPKFAFTGTVTSASYLALPGAKVTGTFQYAVENMSPKRQIALYGLPGSNSVHYPMSAPAGITAKVGGHTIVGEGLSVYVANDSGGNVEDVVTLGGGYVEGSGDGGIVVDGTTYPQGTLGLSLATAPGNTGVLTDTRLPRTYPVAAFDGWRDGYVLIDGSFNGRVLLFRIDSIESLKD